MVAEGDLTIQNVGHPLLHLLKIGGWMMDSNGLDAASGLYGKKLLGTHVCTQQCFGSLGLAIQIEALSLAFWGWEAGCSAFQSCTRGSCDRSDFTKALEVGKAMGVCSNSLPNLDMIVYIFG